MVSMRCWKALVLSLVLPVLLGGLAASADDARVSKLLGRVVVTPDGELLGRIEDMSIDLQENRIRFVVVSIGSYLIDDNLIAVDPHALGTSSDGNYLVVYSDDLGAAQRFSANGWPEVADVRPAADRTPVKVKNPEVLAGEQESANKKDDVVATISDGRRTATLKQGGQRAVIEAPEGVSPPDQIVAVKPKRFQGGRTEVARSAAFARLDEDGDGYLSRREIGSQLDRRTKFSALDLDGNDGIDEFEYQVLNKPSP